MTGRDGSRTSGPRAVLLTAVVVIAIVAGLAAVVTTLFPPPPRVIAMATGAPGSNYAKLGERYREILARSGVQVKLVPTAGSVENLAQLRDPKSGVSVALVQSGLTTAEQSPTLVSLGTLFYEPMWVFLRGPDVDADNIDFLKGRTVSIGAPGSGVNAMARRLIDTMNLAAHNVRIVELSQAESMEQLQRGQIDAMLLVAAWESPVVQQLLKDPGITAHALPRADAIVALTPNLSKVTVPRGAADLGRDRPPADLTLVANKGSLIVRENLHPALQYLLLEAASEIHGAPGIFNRSGQFPAAEPVDLPLSEQARRFYQSGRPFLQRYLPFWMAVLVERLLILLIPVVGVIYPVVKILPNLYRWSMQRRIYRLYGELKLLETELEARPSGAPADDLSARLVDLEQRANRLRVPAAFAHLLYTLRMHIGLVRSSLIGRSSA
ncbi:MAG TPA: TAXI family TRAP transporter solute-binding subunit [Steroidobacteraceae bacterium]|nr:TAXI family TRAP transporter solute-binding subunit [Steroidobacteraceae bacterium]